MINLYESLKYCFLGHRELGNCSVQRAFPFDTVHLYCGPTPLPAHRHQMESQGSLRQVGVHILKYLDNWLNLAQLEAELNTHRSVLLSHLQCLGLNQPCQELTVPEQVYCFPGSGV